MSILPRGWVEGKGGLGNLTKGVYVRLFEKLLTQRGFVSDYSKNFLVYLIDHLL